MGESGYHGMKKGKKMPSIELEGHSEAQFKLVDGKIVRVETPSQQAPMQGPSFDLDRRLTD